MIEGEVAQNIAELGFPAAMCFWYMFKTDKNVKNNTEALMKIRETISEVKGIIQQCHEGNRNANKS